MATDQVLVDQFVSNMGDAGEVVSRKMFGDHGIYCDGKFVALTSDGDLFVKPTEGAAAFADACEQAPPYPGAKDYFLVPKSKWDDREWLGEFIRATADALPEPKPKTPKPKKT